METTTTTPAATATAPSQRPPAGVQKRRKPSGETSHVCPFCGRAFKRSEHKERHVRTHTKEKPFVCHCGSAFTRRDLLTRHQRIATHEKIQDANPVKPDQSGVPPAVDIGPELTSPISPSDIGMTNPWDQNSHLNSFYQTNGSAPEEQHILHHMQQPIMPQEYYQGHDFQNEFGDFGSFTQYDDSGLPLGWNANAYFQPSDTGEDYLDPQLQETISISI